jgi:hypothetical protein
MPVAYVGGCWKFPGFEDISEIAQQSNFIRANWRNARAKKSTAEISVTRYL